MQAKHGEGSIAPLVKELLANIGEDPRREGLVRTPERVERALRIAGIAEIESILAERGDVEVTCEFCNRRYAFGPAEARAVFAPEALSARH